MSRAERRLAERLNRRKPKAPRRVNPDYAITLLKDALEMNSVERVSEAERDAFMLPLYTKMQLLVSGGLDIPGYYDISEFIVFSLYLCSELMFTSKGEARDELQRIYNWVGEARLTMAQIADRYNRVGKFGASGSELRVVQNSIDLLSELLMLADKRHVQRARRRTDVSMVDLLRIQAESVAANQIV